jgi:hypothetical protein
VTATASSTTWPSSPAARGSGRARIRARLGDERTTLVEARRVQRLTLEMKCAGLDPGAMARRSVEPSTMSLLGLVRLLAEVEHDTFRILLGGQDVLRLYCTAERDWDFDGAVPDPHGSGGGPTRSGRRA